MRGPATVRLHPQFDIAESNSKKKGNKNKTVVQFSNVQCLCERDKIHNKKKKKEKKKYSKRTDKKMSVC